ncbi:MAG: hypothetical protein HYU60_02265 [Magnetospirillum sp.]|nr:hypothetical protein [Magnetospirillum sp.]
MGGFSDSFGDMAQMGLSMANGLSTARADSDANADAYAARQAALDAQYQEQQRHREDLLEAQMASQRARLAAAGIGSSGGSGDAILRGLASRSAQDQADSATLYGLRSTALARQSAAGSRGGSAGLERMLMSSGGSLLDGWGGNGGGMAAGEGAVWMSTE